MMSGEDDKRSFWKTVPGILTGIAAILTAIGGLIVAYHTLYPEPEATAEINQTPAIEAIEFNPVSPSPMGEPILITIKANDSDNDKIYYKFMIKGPKDLDFMSRTGWITDNKWEWIPTVDDVGNNKIRVYVRDEKHPDEDSDYVDRDFKIKGASDLNSDALDLYRQGKYIEAIKAYEEAIMLDPHYEEAFYNKGLSHAALGEYIEAIKAYEEAIMLDPYYEEAFYNKGLALAALGNYNESIQAYNEAIKLVPNHTETFYNKGLALYALGKCNEAIKAYKEAIKLDPNYEDAIMAQGIAGKSGSVRVKCNGGYVAGFKLSYKLDGAVQTIKSGAITLGNTKKVEIPPCANDISLTVEYNTGLNWKTIFNKNYDKPVTKCFEVSGTVFKAKYKEC